MRRSITDVAPCQCSWLVLPASMVPISFPDEEPFVHVPTGVRVAGTVASDLATFITSSPWRRSVAAQVL